MLSRCHNTIVCTKPTPLTTSILVALGVGLSVPALAGGGITALAKPNQGLQCIGTVQHNLNGTNGQSTYSAPSATSVRSHNPSPTAFGGKSELKAVVEELIDEYNNVRVHRSIGRGGGLCWRTN